MIRSLSLPVLETRSAFLSAVRRFFFDRGYIEVETPLLNPTGGFEPFLDPIRVSRSGVRKSPEHKEKETGYLVTSPEYNLKIIAADVRRDVFQIAHVFREGDAGPIHTEEFLMLEWYKMDADDRALAAETRALLESVAAAPFSRTRIGTVKSWTVEELLRRHASCGMGKTELWKAAQGAGLTLSGSADALRYDEIFFTVFLNLIEPGISEGVHFIHDYPKELAALARIEGEKARRFEVYWNGIELANGYFELASRREQEERFAGENELRERLGKPRMEMNHQFLDAVGRLPDCAGIALGLDRLLLVLLGARTVAEVSPFL